MLFVHVQVWVWVYVWVAMHMLTHWVITLASMVCI